MGCGAVSTPISNPIPSSSKNGDDSSFVKTQPYFMYANGHSKEPETKVQVRILDGTVSSPYPPEYSIPTNISFWQLILHYIKSVVESKAGHLDWLVETSASKGRLKYSELEPKSLRLASGLYKLGLRPRQAVVVFSRDLCKINLVYFALWRINAVVWIAGINSNGTQLVEQIDASGALFLLCDKHTEQPALEAMKKRKIILLSVGKLRQSTSIDIIDLLVDDGRDCPSQVNFDQDDVILITRNGSSHTHRSLITGSIQGGILRTTPGQSFYTKCYLYPVNEGHCELANILWPLGTLMIGKTLILMDRPTSQTVVVTLREFSVSTICGCPEFIQSVSKHIAEQGGSMPSIASLILKSSSSMSYSERILRKGFPNIKTIDILYGLEECLFVTSTIPKKVEDIRITSAIYSNGPLLHPHSVGALCSYTTGKVIDLDTGVRLGPGETGELCFKSESSMKHYTDKPGHPSRKTIIDSWIHSGDFGYFDSYGTFYVLGRVEEVFQYYADYISPRELEHVVQSHPDVLNCAVIGVPDSMAGRLPCAIIVRRVGSQVSAKEIRTFVNSRVSNYKQLRGGILFLDQLPSCKDVFSLRRKLLEHVQKVYSNKSWID